MQHLHYSRFLVLVFTYVLIQTKRKSNPEATLIIRPDRKWLERNFEEEIFISFQYVRISILWWRWISIGVCLLNYPWWITRFVYFTFFYVLLRVHTVYHNIAQGKIEALTILYICILSFSCIHIMFILQYLEDRK